MWCDRQASHGISLSFLLVLTSLLAHLFCRPLFPLSGIIRHAYFFMKLLIFPSLCKRVYFMLNYISILTFLSHTRCKICSRGSSPFDRDFGFFYAHNFLLIQAHLPAFSFLLLLCFGRSSAFPNVTPINFFFFFQFLQVHFFTLTAVIHQEFILVCGRCCL